MATKNTAPAKTEAELLEEMYALLTPEQREALDALTGQANAKGGVKTPVLRVSYKESDDTDTNGKSVKKGNFVIGQKSHKEKKGDKYVDVIDEIGTDLGNELEVVLLASGTQYSFFSELPGQSCSSQVCRERNEVPVGSTLKHVCTSGKCPRRQEGIDKKEKCSHQYVMFVKLPEGTKLPDGTDCPCAILYVKGTSYMNAKEYLAGTKETDLKTNALMVKTILKTEKDKSGAVTFFLTKFKQGAIDQLGFQENFKLASTAMQNLEDFKASNQRALPAPDSARAPDEVTHPGTSSDEEIPW